MPALTDADTDIAAAARRWATLQAGGTMTPASRRRFERWLAADSRHPKALEASRRLLESLGELKGLQAYARLPPRPRGLAARARLWWAEASARPARAWAGVGLTLAAAYAAAVVLAPLASLSTHTYRTEVGQTREVALADGSQVDLGPASTLRVSFGHGRRQAYLDNGEAFFSVAKKHGAPFYVDAGDTVVRVVGTQFNVHHGQRRVRVEVREGVVRVAAKGDEAHAVELLRGQAVLSDGGRMTPRALDADLAGAWRDGRVYYEGASLREVVEDARRFAPAKVVFASPAAAQLQVTASFRTRDFRQFLTGLETVLPVDVATRPDGTLVIDRAATAKAG